MEKTEIRFGVLRFELVGNKITLNGFPFVEIQIAGQNKDNHLGAKHVCLSEHANLEYVSHGRVGNVLRIVQEDALVRAVSVFTSFEDTSALAVYTEVMNISAEDITILFRVPGCCRHDGRTFPNLSAPFFAEPPRGMPPEEEFACGTWLGKSDTGGAIPGGACERGQLVYQRGIAAGNRGARREVYNVPDRELSFLVL